MSEKDLKEVPVEQQVPFSSLLYALKAKVSRDLIEQDPTIKIRNAGPILTDPIREVSLGNVFNELERRVKDSDVDDIKRIADTMTEIVDQNPILGRNVVRGIRSLEHAITQQSDWYTPLI